MTHNYRPPHKVNTPLRLRGDFTLIPLDNKTKEALKTRLLLFCYHYNIKIYESQSDCHDNIRLKCGVGIPE